MDGRCFWNLNSTAEGRGVSKTIATLMPYARAAVIDTRWFLFGGTDEFFHVTKRIHNLLHNSPGDGGELDADPRSVYESVSDQNASELTELVEPGDIVVAHDAQTAGVFPYLQEIGARVVWHCHVGTDNRGELAGAAWELLSKYVAHADCFAFARRKYLWEEMDVSRLRAIPPSIDAFSPENRDIDDVQMDVILKGTGVLEGSTGVVPRFTKQGGTEDAIRRSDRTSHDVGGASRGCISRCAGVEMGCPQGPDGGHGEPNTSPADPMLTSYLRGQQSKRCRVTPKAGRCSETA